MSGLATSHRNATNCLGQQQRVALARAIVGRPRVLLFDEPLSNLDAKLREEMRYFLKDIQRKIKITAIYVTHDQAEAMALGHELLVMNAGKIEQRGSARSLYCEPETSFVANFIGVASFIRARIRSIDPDDSHSVVVELEDADGKSSLLRVRSQEARIGSNVAVTIRPEWITLHTIDSEVSGNLIGGAVHKSQFLGDRTEAIVDTKFGQMRVWMDGLAEFSEGEHVQMEVDAERCIALPVD